MRIQEIIVLCAEAADIMAEYGLHCFSCSIGGIESLQDGCKMHGFDDETIDALIDDLNESIRNEQPRPQMLTVTREAARAIRIIAQAEKKEGQGLAVIIDADGGFYMEFRKKADPDDSVFTNEHEPDVRILASSITLWRIGGATIDYRDERFKLDFFEDDDCSFCDKDSVTNK